MHDIPYARLLYLVMPLSFVLYFYGKWTENKKILIYAVARMVMQLVVVGHILAAIFSQHYWLSGVLILIVMLVISVFIILRNTAYKSFRHYFIIFCATALTTLVNLWLVVALVLDIDKTYEPRILIPLAGMIFYTIMNTLSLAIERFETEYQKQNNFANSRQTAFTAAMIPQVNALLAVGLVALPGMMTGQILSGVEPLVAVRYQIVIMVLSVSGGGGSLVFYFLMYEKFQLHKALKM